ncbi:Uncharacterised protein [Streptococcus pneumoniae]|nr:hypothetical protein [Streptococcus pneumoniae]SNE69851.1 Uncharacterised protein [Streptococcus pneumoniae]
MLTWFEEIFVETDEVSNPTYGKATLTRIDLRQGDVNVGLKSFSKV